MVNLTSTLLPGYGVRLMGRSRVLPPSGQRGRTKEPGVEEIGTELSIASADKMLQDLDRLLVVGQQVVPSAFKLRIHRQAVIATIQVVSILPHIRMLMNQLLIDLQCLLMSGFRLFGLLHVMKVLNTERAVGKAQGVAVLGNVRAVSDQCLIGPYRFLQNRRR